MEKKILTLVDNIDIIRNKHRETEANKLQNIFSFKIPVHIKHYFKRKMLSRIVIIYPSV